MVTKILMTIVLALSLCGEAVLLMTMPFEVTTLSMQARLYCFAVAACMLGIGAALGAAIMDLWRERAP